ncbi:hypothetical protein [Elioraea rosea]|uniref:hypothetical protein n=1 Tax=Elioraea rosea TaxID=2492390 RepID=UPI0013150A7B|nr:hypothetical protein [Elioraea rosea]
MQQIIALRIGARREAVSREFGRQLRAGMLAPSRSALVIRSPGVLEAAIAAELAD